MLDIGRINRKTTGAMLRMDLDRMIARLKKTVCSHLKLGNLPFHTDTPVHIPIIFNNSLQKTHFIRCVKPNLNQTPGVFDENFVCEQLQSSGCTAYYELMQFGYPDKIKISDLYDKLAPVLQSRHTSIGRLRCCLIFLLANGFKAEDLRSGKSSINIRPGNSKLLEKLQIEINDFNPESVLKFNNEFLNHERRVLILRLRFISKRKFIY